MSLVREGADEPARFDFAAPPAFLRLIADPSDALAARAVAEAGARWLRSPVAPLDAFLGLPESPEAWRAVRDLELCRAADHVTPDESPRRGRPQSPLDRRVAALLAELRAFKGTRWPAWQRMHEPPAYCRPVDRHLFRAMKCRCAEPPASRPALKRIIGG